MDEKLINRVMSQYLRTTEAGKKPDPKELKKGIEEEKEHTDVWKLFSKYLKKHDLKTPITYQDFLKFIAIAHLEKTKNYYTLLDKYVEKGSHKVAMDFTGLEVVRRQGKALDPRELARALRLAISAEHDAAHLYELIADSTTNAKVRKVVNDIAGEEKIHVGELESLLNSIDKENEKLVDEGKAEAEDK